MQAVIEDPFDPMSFRSFIPAGAVFVQLPGVSHPSPKKAEQFKAIDLRSVQASADVAAFAGVSNSRNSVAATKLVYTFCRAVYNFG
ncbi:MAG: hypothetical protein IT250_14635 [Chitinophagaceae bacterium]|nr:hypothetical protein [Chitinophagaceae bacterium]